LQSIFPPPFLLPWSISAEKGKVNGEKVTILYKSWKWDLAMPEKADWGWEELHFEEIICYRNVIIFKKGVAFCKQVCYNTVTYI